MEVQPDVIDIDQMVERSRVGVFQPGLLTLWGLCLVMDGFDIDVMGYVAPAIIGDGQISRTSLGSVFGAGLLVGYLGAWRGDVVLVTVVDTVFGLA